MPIKRNHGKQLVFKADEKHRSGEIKEHFLDSGSFTLWTKAAKYAEENGTERWAYYDTDEFWEYMESYARFVRKNKIAIDLCANIDVIPNPELSWRNLKWLEKHGINPVPVIHFGGNAEDSFKWLKRHIKEGYEIIGLGGMVGSTDQWECRWWLDRCFEIICAGKDRLPCVKMHGFGITNYNLMVRYPWYSVDSTSWTKVGAFGGILVPHRRGGRYMFFDDRRTPIEPVEPYILQVSAESPAVKNGRTHLTNLSQAEHAVIKGWLDEIGIPIGKRSADGEIEELGVLTTHVWRRAANLFFYERLCAALPEWPWPYHVPFPKPQGFGFK